MSNPENKPKDTTMEIDETKTQPAGLDQSQKVKTEVTVDGATMDAALFRKTSGLPRKELNMMLAELSECESSLHQEISMLEKALEQEKEEPSTEVQTILHNVLTPLDRYWTASALLGRLRDEWTLPTVLIAMEAEKDSQKLEFIKEQLSSDPPNNNAVKLATCYAKSVYFQEQENTAALLAVWKKISNSKTSFVFKRPVRPEEAPGYAERIVFPMDLSMVRKLIVSRTISSYAELHKYIGLIAHNCVKYNGRESDYGRVARDFEAAADELIRQAVDQHETSPAVLSRTSPGPTAKSTNKDETAS